jgi:hypothetical protein
MGLIGHLIARLHYPSNAFSRFCSSRFLPASGGPAKLGEDNVGALIVEAARTFAAADAANGRVHRQPQS